LQQHLLLFRLLYNRALASKRTLDQAADQHGISGITSTPQLHGTPLQPQLPSDAP